MSEIGNDILDKEFESCIEQLNDISINEKEFCVDLQIKSFGELIHAYGIMHPDFVK